MPKPRALPPEEEQKALAAYKAANGKRGTVQLLANLYGLTWPGMKALLKRVERENEIKDSRESLISGEGGA